MLISPRIYYLFSPLFGTADMLAVHLSKCRQMGFTHIMAAADLFDTAQSEETDHQISIKTIASACQKQGLSLLLDVDFGASAPVKAVHRQDHDTLPDPRHPGSAMSVDNLAQRPGKAPAADLAFCNDRLQQWRVAGVAGFCCRALAGRSTQFWQDLIVQARATEKNTFFIASTLDCTTAQLSALEQCGFDATIASTAWWDYSAKWLEEEATRLARIAPAIAMVDNPLNAMLHRARHGEDELVFRARCTRALNFAAASGFGLLMPMGMESGISGMRDFVSGATHDLDAISSQPDQDFSEEISQANALVESFAAMLSPSRGITIIRPAPAQPGVVAVLRETIQKSAKSAGEALLIVVNQKAATPITVMPESFNSAMDGRMAQQVLWPQAEINPDAHAEVDTGVDSNADANVAAAFTLAPGALKIMAVRHLPAIINSASRGKRSAETACRAARIAIEAVSPTVDNGQFPVKRTVAENVDIKADVFMDGHDKLSVLLLWRTTDTTDWQEVRMKPLGNDRWHAVLPLQRVGRYKYTVLAWRDAFATYRDELAKKVAAGLDVTLEIEEGRLLIESAAAHATAAGNTATAQTLSSVLAHLKPATAAGRKTKTRSTAVAGATSAATHQEALQQPLLATIADTATASVSATVLAIMLSDETLRAMQEADDRGFAVRYEPEMTIDAERVAARFSSWYELFPRSQSGDVNRHGTFADVEKRLPAIRDMGFDMLYFPPIHPIGKTNRKGPNNSLTPGETDPGSPYAIGSAAGGHDALHPELGTLEDFRRLRAAAHRHGLELALDFAIQCSPDHPWIKDHPDWFAWRPDGSMRYAENPPKKYEDIVNVDFYATGAMPALWIALRDAVLFWVNEGVRVFRVDNPHTKPLPFWQWMIGDIRNRFPDVIFLSEAFTRPKVMYRLAKVGFSQSYTYFTWRHTQQEFIDYLTELSTTGVKDYFRPHFFVNTPDINPGFLQKSGRAGFLIRAALATTLSGLWGMYSGFELCEATPVPGKEDYLDSEKYELRAWDWQRPGNIIAEISTLNKIRRANPALQSHLGIQFVESSNPNLLCFLKFPPRRTGVVQLEGNVVFVAINLDPLAGHETTFSLPLWQFGIPDHGTLAVEDLVHGNQFALHGKTHQLRLDHSGLPYAIWRLEAPNA